MLRHADSVWLITPEHELISGAPEEIGLAGHLQHTVDGAATFDPRTGTFTWDSGRSATARVVQDSRSAGQSSSAVMRAVERAGYRIGDDEADVTVGIRSAGSWLVGSHEVDSLATMVALLRNGG
jgi:iron complex transport system ATP-binding protein